MISYQRFIDLLAMSRFANLPTVWSNALLGTLFGMDTSKDGVAPSFGLIAGAMTCLYLGGCFLNDWHDAAYDAEHREDRAIPAGRWSRASIGTFAFALLGLGLALAFSTATTTGVFAVGIVVCILAYTRWHKVNAGSFFFMAGARALIYPACFFSFLRWDQFKSLNPEAYPALIFMSLMLGSYILGISLLARNESKPNPTSAQQIVPVIFLTAPGFFIGGALLLDQPLITLPALLLFLGVLAFCVRKLRSTKNIGQFVSRALAAIPLVDYLAIGPIALAGFLDGNTAAGPLLIICPALALLALLFQRIAPAT
ncbi:MAG: UbiA family prenyltransferase [Akkermansiaceae bacterium]